MATVLFHELRLETREGNQIPNRQRSEQIPQRLAVAASGILERHGTAILRSCTGLYNCYGLAFASRRTWVDNDAGGVVEMILDQDGYENVKRLDCVPGDVVVYRDEEGEAVHAAVVTEVRTLSDEVYVVSQWGADGEYTHREDDVDFRLGQPIEYWTDRRSCQQ